MLKNLGKSGYRVLNKVLHDNNKMVVLSLIARIVVISILVAFIVVNEHKTLNTRQPSNLSICD